MFVGHALLAFSVVATIARWRGWEHNRVIQAGVLAALFATTPDLDILYGPVGLLGGVSGVADAAEAFWSTGNVVHRGPTHSLVVGAVAATAFACWRRATVGSRTLSVVTVTGIVAMVAVFSGILGALVTVLFLAGGLLVVELAARWDVPPRTVGVVAAVGLVTHPFGDLFTGTPPSLLYPFDVALVSERLSIHPDPTLGLLGAFGVELLVVWTALVVAFSLTDRSIRYNVDYRAVIGLSYGGAVLALPPPTFETSYHFVFSVLALGMVGLPRLRIREIDLPRATCTGLAAVTFAWVAFVLAYLAV